MKLNQAAFAKELGVTRQTVTLWKKSGMPVDCRESAAAWVIENHPKYLEKLSEEIDGINSGDAPDRGGNMDGLDLHSTLNRFREIEYRAWKDLDAALIARKDAKPGTKSAHDLDAAIVRGSKRYKDAANDRLGMEQRVADFELETGRRIPTDEVKDWINDRFAGLVVQLNAAPHMLARECNPDDPETPKRCIERWVKNVMRQQREEVDENE